MTSRSKLRKEEALLTDITIPHNRIETFLEKLSETELTRRIELDDLEQCLTLAAFHLSLSPLPLLMLAVIYHVLRMAYGNCRIPRRRMHHELLIGERAFLIGDRRLAVTLSGDILIIIAASIILLS